MFSYILNNITSLSIVQYLGNHVTKVNDKILNQWKDNISHKMQGRQYQSLGGGQGATLAAAQLSTFGGWGNLPPVPAALSVDYIVFL